MNKKMRFTAAGDALMMKRLPAAYEGFAEVRDFLLRGEARIVNLETTLTDGDATPSAESGGTWLTADPAVGRDLTAFGFNLFGWANNHAMDFSYDGLEETRRNLQEMGVAAAGAGRNLAEASRAAMLDAPDARVAMIAVCSTFANSARAGAQNAYGKGRPGLNPLRFDTEYTVTEQQLTQLIEIARATGLNAFAEQMVAQGFQMPLPTGTFDFGGIRFTAGEMPAKHTRARSTDVERTVHGVRDALRVADYAVVMTHSHEIRFDNDEEPDEFLEQFAHAVIDAGASAVIGGGTHQLKGIELYRGKPIFYSLGNFIFQNAFAPILPTDFMEQNHLPLDSTAAEGIAGRAAHAQKGLTQNPLVYRSALPYFAFEDDRLTELTLMPITLGMGLPRHFSSWPHPADAQEAKEICDYLTRVSARFGTKMHLQDGLIRVAVE